MGGGIALSFIFEKVKIILESCLKILFKHFTSFAIKKQLHSYLKKMLLPSESLQSKYKKYAKS